MPEEKRGRFPGVCLTEESLLELRRLKKTSELRSRLWRRIRILELLNQGWDLTRTAEAAGTYRREVRRIGWRYLEGGLEHSLKDDPRPHPKKILDTRTSSQIVAMVCGPAPEGHCRWTIRLTVEEATRREIVPSVGRETIRQLFLEHDFKPWREKNVVRP